MTKLVSSVQDCKCRLFWPYDGMYLNYLGALLSFSGELPLLAMGKAYPAVSDEYLYAVEKAKKKLRALIAGLVHN